MTAQGEIYIGEDCSSVFEEELNEWFGKDEWELNSSPFGDCWDMSEFPNVIEVEVIDKDRKKIGKVLIENEFNIEGSGYERDINCEPKSIELLETDDKLKDIVNKKINQEVKQKVVDKLLDRTKFDILRKLRQQFIKEDEEEPFLNREYVEETIRIFDLLINPSVDISNNLADKPIYDIVTDIFKHYGE